MPQGGGAKRLPFLCPLLEHGGRWKRLRTRHCVQVGDATPRRNAPGSSGLCAVEPTCHGPMPGIDAAMVVLPGYRASMAGSRQWFARPMGLGRGSAARKGRQRLAQRMGGKRRRAPRGVRGRSGGIAARSGLVPESGIGRGIVQGRRGLKEVHHSESRKLLSRSSRPAGRPRQRSANASSAARTASYGRRISHREGISACSAAIRRTTRNP